MHRNYHDIENKIHYENIINGIRQLETFKNGDIKKETSTMYRISFSECDVIFLYFIILG